MDLSAISFDLSSLGEAPRPEPEALYDLLVLGGGPASLSAAIYAARKLLRVAILSQELGGQLTGTSEVENYLGFQSITGKELADRFAEHARRFEIPVGLGARVAGLAPEGDDWSVTLEDGARYRAKAVLVATGKRHRHLGVPGEQELAGRGVAYCATCDAPFFKDRRVVVAGGGNSAVGAAIDLGKLATEVTVVNFAEGWQADPILLRTVRAQRNTTLLDHHAVVRIEGTSAVEAVVIQDRAGGAERRLEASGIFVEIGLLPNTDMLRGVAALGPGGELQVDCHCRTSAPGLFGAGDATTVPYNQIVISAGEGAKAALAAYDHLLHTGRL